MTPPCTREKRRARSRSASLVHRVGAATFYAPEFKRRVAPSAVQSALRAKTDAARLTDLLTSPFDEEASNRSRLIQRHAAVIAHYLFGKLVLPNLKAYDPGAESRHEAPRRTPLGHPA